MSEVKRHLVVAGSECSEMVYASDYDALMQRCRQLESENEDLTFALEDAEQRAANAGRNASAFEDRMRDLQVENGKLRDLLDTLGGDD